MEMGLEGGVAFYLGRTVGSPYVCQSFLLRVHRLQPHWILKQYALIFVGSPMEGCKTKPDCFLLPFPLLSSFLITGSPSTAQADFELALA